MITADDSSVLMAIYLGESTADRWLDRLIAAPAEGVLMVSPGKEQLNKKYPGPLRRSVRIGLNGCPVNLSGKF